MVLPVGTTTVTGALGGGDEFDYMSFTGLTPGANFTLLFGPGDPGTGTEASKDGSEASASGSASSNSDASTSGSTSSDSGSDASASGSTSSDSGSASSASDSGSDASSSGSETSSSSSTSGGGTPADSAFTLHFLDDETTLMLFSGDSGLDDPPGPYVPGSIFGTPGQSFSVSGLIPLDGVLNLRLASTAATGASQPYEISLTVGATSTDVPEPGTLGLLGAGLAGSAGLGFLRRRRRKR